MDSKSHQYYTESMWKKITAIFIITTYYLLHTTSVYAHEAYVLTHQEFQKGLSQNTTNPLAGLFDPNYIQISAIITLCVVLAYAVVVLWSTSSIALWLDKIIRKAKVVGPLIIRVAISASFFYAAQANCVLGPELSLAGIPGGFIIRFLLFAISLMILTGIFVEIAAFLGLLIFIYISKFYGLYMITYVNYLGELLVLFLFGSRFLSFDRFLFGKKAWFVKLEKLRNLETPIVRMLYGIALIYAGWTIKFQHQELSIMVYNQYHLKDFFHAGAQFIAAGAGLSEITIGLFILLGLVMRFTVLISLFFITLSILYFREMLWPHFMLYGISFSLLINSGDKFTIDKYLIQWLRGIISRVFR